MEIIALRKAFPAIENAEDSILAMAAWFHFLCNIDDEIERMDSLERNLVLGRIIEALHAMTLDQPHLTEHIKPLRSIKDIFKRVEMSSHRKILLTTQKRTAINSDPGAFSNIVSQVRMMGHDLAKNDHVKALALASSFIRQCQVVLSPRALPKVFTEVVNVLEALKEESAYLDRKVLPSIEDYLRLRVRTIGLTPFFAILANISDGVEAQEAKEFRAGNNSDGKHLHDNRSTTSSSGDTSSFWTSPLHKRFSDCIQRTVGLQNDIVGLDKDIEKGEKMNLAVLLVEQQNETTENLEAIHRARATAVLMHNTEMQNVIRRWADIKAANHSHVVQVYAQSLVAFTRTHFTWASHANRYHLKHGTISERFSNVAKSTAVEGLRFKARVIRTRKSLQQLRVSH
ncbi:hypothetical protein TUN199_05176 [Pyrenophora tritici-repentis]|nr:hypothetical protein Alg130_00012 [Pyrenophora tritici-repentis]KAI0622815.1 hypothetical protein TUN199_05176 [Pyrenophora tritici-repentis]